MAESVDIFKVMTLLIDLFGSVAIVVTIVYASKQLKLSKNVHEQTLAWNKKVLTEKELSAKPDQQRSSRLNVVFKDYVCGNAGKIPKPIPLYVILTEIEKDHSVRADIHHYLNKYERISRGIRNGLYDESTVIGALKNTMIKIFVNYREYILHRQAGTNPNAWGEFQKLVQSWNPDADHDTN